MVVKTEDKGKLGFRIGIILIVVSFLFCASSFIFGALAFRGTEFPWFSGAVAAFVLNWIAFAVGILLVGPATARRIRGWLSGSPDATSTSSGREALRPTTQTKSLQDSRVESASHRDSLL